MNKISSRLFYSPLSLKNSNNHEKEFTHHIYRASPCVLRFSTESIDDNEDLTTWQGVMRMWCEAYEINDAQRMAVVDQIISVFDMIDDTTITAEQLEEPICKMKENIEHVIDTDGYFEFAQMMRATARNLAGRMPADSRLQTDFVSDLMLLDGRWQTLTHIAAMIVLSS